MTEPLPAQNVYVDGISAVEFRGDTVWVELFVNLENGSATGDNMVAVRLIFGTTSYLTMIEDMVAGKCSAKQVMHG